MILDELQCSGLVETEYGPTFVRKIGQGPLLFVIHGGPGFNHSYLALALEFLSTSRTLIFYDQPGCGLTPAPDVPLTLEFIAEHFRSLSSQLAPGCEVEFIAHSWGTLVLVAALANDSSAGRMPIFRSGVLINPSPITYNAYFQAYESFVRQLPEAVANEVFAMVGKDETGRELIDLLLPYYGLHSAINPDGIIRVNHKTYREITGAMTDFDLSDAPSKLGKSLIVYGENDFLGVSLAGPFVDHAETVIKIDDAAHFPFFEQPAEFRDAVTRFLDIQ